jgi:hypothetical protein
MLGRSDGRSAYASTKPNAFLGKNVYVGRFFKFCGKSELSQKFN